MPARAGAAEDIAERRAAAEALDGALRALLPPETFYVILLLEEPEPLDEGARPAVYLPAWYISSAPPEERETLVKPRLRAWVAREQERLVAAAAALAPVDVE